MKRRLVIVLSAVLFGCLAVGAVRAASAPTTNQDARAVTPALATNQTAKAEAHPRLTVAQQKRLVELGGRMKQCFDEKKYDEAKSVVEEMVKIQPDSPGHWYNLACAQSRLGETAEAVKNLEIAVEKGWTGFQHLERDQDLDNVSHERGYLALLARKDEIQKKRAEKINEDLTRQFGAGCLHTIDDEYRLVFATTTDQRTLDELRVTLTDYAEALSKDLFTHKPERYVTIIIPRVWRGGQVGGFYNTESAMLQAKGFSGTVIHEFVHALHDGDASARGQEHPIWVKEGLATLFEDSDVVDGRIVPEHNHRLNAILLRAKVDRHIPWKKFMGLQPSEFLRQPANNYAQARYLFFYLYARERLAAWYRNYVETFPQDNTGAQAWEKTFGQPLAEIEKDWVAWLLTLNELPIRVQEGNASFGIEVRPANDGLVVAQVQADGGAARAGLKPQDVIVRIEDRRLADITDIQRTLNGRQVGDRLRVEYRRGTEYQNAVVELTPAPSPFKSKPAKEREATPKSSAD